MAHFSNHAHQPIHLIWVPNVFVGLVEHDQLVEGLPLERGVREELKQHHKKTESFVLLDKLVPKIDDHQPARPNHFAQPRTIVNIVLRQVETHGGQFLQVVWESCVIQGGAECRDGQVVTQ